MRDPYQVLGVAKGASSDDIKKAFKRKARKYHPDVNTEPGAEEPEAISIFRDVAERDPVGYYGIQAANRLLDLGADQLYSRVTGVKPEHVPSQALRGEPGGGFPGGGPGFQDLGDLLGSIFGGGAARSVGRDLTTRLTVDPMTSFVGGVSPIRIRRPEGGTETLNLRVPAGARDGERLRVRGRGQPPPGGGPCGDLIVTLSIAEHPLLERAGDDLLLDVPVTILEAIEGGEIEVPTPTGPARVALPKNCANRKLRLRGRGVRARLAEIRPVTGPTGAGPSSHT